MQKPTDKVGKEIKVGSFVVYGHALGRCAGLRIGKILEIRSPKTDYNKEAIHFSVQGVDDDWNFKPPHVCRKGTLQFPDRILVIPEKSVPVHCKILLGKPLSKEAFIEFFIASIPAGKNVNVRYLAGEGAAKAWEDYRKAKGIK